MAGQAPNNSFSGQAQMKSEDQSQNNNFLQETGSHAKNMVHGATDVGRGAVLGAASLAGGIASGAANVAKGTTDAIKNTLGESNNPRGNN